MIFHENRLVADDSHVISCFILFENEKRCRNNLSSAAVVIGALRVNLNHSRQASRDSILQWTTEVSIVSISMN